MAMAYRWRLWVGAATMLAVFLALAASGDAHERRRVGNYIMRVGWADEPTFAGAKNGVQLLLSDASGKPVTDLPEDLKVEVIFGTQKMGPLPLDAAFGKSFGRPGDFRAALIPTRPGNYTFHFIGSLNGQHIDQSFTSSDKTFDPVQEAAAIEFPAKDPSPGELAEKVDRLNSRLETAQAAARDAAAGAHQARLLGAIGILAGIAGLVAAVASNRRRSSETGRVGGQVRTE
jgi:hypothetical protein